MFYIFRNSFPFANNVCNIKRINDQNNMSTVRRKLNFIILVSEVTVYYS